MVHLIHELRHTPLQDIALASWPVRALVLVAWSLMMVWMGQRWIIEPQQQVWAMQQQALVQREQAIDDARQRVSSQLQIQQEQEAMLNEFEQTLDVFNAMATWPTWLAWVSDAAAGLGLQYRHDAGLLSLGDSAAWSVMGLKPYVRSQSAHWVVSGSLPELLAWWHQLLTRPAPGRVWVVSFSLHRLDGESMFELRLATQVLTRIQSVDLGAVALSDHPSDNELVPMARSLIEPWSEYSLGWGLQHPDLWRTLPLSRLTLVGLGQWQDRPFVWLLDHSNSLRQLQVDDVLAGGRYRLLGWEDQQAHLLDQHSQQTITWTLP